MNSLSTALADDAWATAPLGSSPGAFEAEMVRFMQARGPALMTPLPLWPIQHKPRCCTNTG